MTVRHLKIFITVVDCNSMSGAAEKLFISQPSVSQAVAELEKHYGVRLFERLSQKLYITDSGRQLLTYARHIVESFEQMEQTMLHNSEIPRLHIGCSVSVGTYLLNDLLDVIESTENHPQIIATVDNTSTIEELLLSNDLDLGIVEGMVKSTELITTPVYQDELVLVCGKDHPLAHRTNITFADLEGVNFISREQGSIERNQLENILSRHKINLNRCWHSTNTEAIKNAVIRGKGIAILSNMLIQEECRKGDMLVLDLKDMHFNRTIHMIYHKNKFMSRSLQDVIDLLKRGNVWNPL